MTPFLTLVLVGVMARSDYQMARSPVLPGFAQDLGAAPELLGLIVAASTVTSVIVKLPAGALSDLIGRKRMLVLGGLFFARRPPFLWLSARSHLAARHFALLVWSRRPRSNDASDLNASGRRRFRQIPQRRSAFRLQRA